MEKKLSFICLHESIVISIFKIYAFFSSQKSDSRD